MAGAMRSASDLLASAPRNPAGKTYAIWPSSETWMAAPVSAARACSASSASVVLRPAREARSPTVHVRPARRRGRAVSAYSRRRKAAAVANGATGQGRQTGRGGPRLSTASRVLSLTARSSFANSLADAARAGCACGEGAWQAFHEGRRRRRERAESPSEPTLPDGSGTRWTRSNLHGSRGNTHARNNDCPYLPT